MPKSLQRGDYSMLMAIESASRPNSWYRVLADRQSGVPSCDCPTWLFNRHPTATGERLCPHTVFAVSLAASAQPSAQTLATLSEPDAFSASLLEAVRQQWPGLRGQWSIEQKAAQINNKPYTVVLLRLALGNGSGVATGVAAFAKAHPMSRERLVAGVAGWCGYAVAAEVARLGGYPMAGAPPEHFKVTRRARSARSPLAVPQIGLLDILRVADHTDLGDGLRPEQRAENTLRLFLGEPLYQQLERAHFLDVSSLHYGTEERVYRLRRDPGKQRERRVRIFEHGRYIRDYCLVRGQDVPEADHFLTVFLGLLSDEMGTLSVLGRHNIFPPNSDGAEREQLPAQWQPRAVAGPPVHALH